jgi:hypothetical protein
MSNVSVALNDLLESDRTFGDAPHRSQPVEFAVFSYAGRCLSPWKLASFVGERRITCVAVFDERIDMMRLAIANNG